MNISRNVILKVSDELYIYKVFHLSMVGVQGHDR